MSSSLKHEKQRAGVNLAMSSWQRLFGRDQAVLLGATQALVTGSDVAATALGALKASAQLLTPAHRPRHAVIFVKNKLLALYSRWEGNGTG